jgi:hypothetical protein
MYNPVLSLIASFIAMVCVVLAYFVKKKAYYLLWELLCIIFLVISYFFDLQFFAMIGVVVAILRTLTFFLFEHYGKTAPLYLAFVFAGLTVISFFVVNYVITKTGRPIDILCLVALVMYAFIFRIRNLKAVRFLMIIPTVLSIIYNVLASSPIFATLVYVFELSANVISIFKYHVLKVDKAH